MKNIEIVEGKVYQLKEKPTMSSSMRGIISMAMIFSSFDPYTKIKKFEAPECDIAEEYRLILQKKSKLTKRQREYIVRTFLDSYAEIELE